LNRALIAALLLSTVPAKAAERWIRLTTPNFEMYTTTDEKTAREAMLHFERVREFFLAVSPARVPAGFPTRIVAFRDAQAYQMYAPNQIAAAYYAPGPLRDSIVMQNPSPESYPITIHEYFHAVVQNTGLRIPLWLNEGWADVFSSLKPVHDGVAVGDLIPDRMKMLQLGQWFSLNELSVVTTKSTVYNESNRTGMFYAESWALAHMLYLSPEYKANFGRFVAALNRGQNMQESLQFAWGKSEQQVYADLQTYFSRKKLYGTVYLTPFEKAGETPVVSSVSDYDSGLMLADLHAATGHQADAARAYRLLEEQDPKRPDAFAAAGYLGIRFHDPDAARKEFTQALALGTTDVQMCMQLAALDRAAQQPPAVVMAVLERAVTLRPTFPEALFQLGLLKVDARDFDSALDLLSRVTTVPPENAALFQATFAYVYLQKGELEQARVHAGIALKSSGAAGINLAAQRTIQLADARSRGPGAARSGEKLTRVAGTAVGLRCETPESGLLSKMGLNVGGKQLLLDLPDVLAVEVDKRPGTTAELKCGPLNQFPLTVEYAASGVPGQTAGVVRRIEY
jgi:tetratricopeptide (TPR) repeat protein